MSKVLVTESSLAGIAAAIRAKNGTHNTYKPGQMAEAIAEIPTGTTPSGTINITQNGTADVTNYASANVNVPNTYAAGDEGKVVSNGALVAQTARASEITANGTYDTTNNNSVTVNVSGGGGGLELNYDFTQSMTDTVRGLPLTSNSVTQTAEGAVMDGTGAYIRLKPRFSANTYTYEIDIASITMRSGSHNRLIMGTNEQGLIYRNSNKWAFYANSWVETNVSDPTYLNGCTVKVYVDQDGYWHIYRNGVLWFEPGLLLNLDTNYNSDISYFTIGARSQAPSSVTVTGLRVY